MKKHHRTLLFALTAPFVLAVANLSMFRVALPTIRTIYGLTADSTAWLVTAYSLAYMICMPLYGWLGDRLSKQKLFIAGICIYSVGTLCVLFSQSIPFIIAGRVIQAIGVSGTSPLCIAAITSRFPEDQRGAALGKWNSTGAFVSMVGPFIAGFLIDRYPWRAIYIPILFIGVIAAAIVWRLFPSSQDTEESSDSYRRMVASFDWVGAVTFGLFFTFFVFYLSSRPITGQNPLTDWRLGFGAIASLVLLVMWERRTTNPIIPLDLFHVVDFIPATACSATRMFVLSAFNMLMPLYLAEVHKLRSSWIGGILAMIFLAHFVSMRIGGTLSDSRRSRWVVIFGLTVQGAVLLSLGFIGDTISFLYLIPILMIHSLGAGVSLAPIHRAAMAQVPKERSGAGAGFYSSVRFGGVLLGPTIAGVALENGFAKFTAPLQAYQRTFLIIAVAVVVSILLSLKIKD